MGGVVGLASCVWPYARLALLLLCLWSPPARLPPRRCLLLLRVCDGLGKFALVDFVMLNLLTVVLRIDASLPRAATRATLAAAAPRCCAWPRGRRRKGGRYARPTGAVRPRAVAPGQGQG